MPVGWYAVSGQRHCCHSSQSHRRPNKVLLILDLPTHGNYVYCFGASVQCVQGQVVVLFDVESFFTSDKPISVYRDDVGVVFEEVCMFIDVIISVVIKLNLYV